MMSCRLAVFAREGRGGGEVVADIVPDLWWCRCWVRGVSKLLAAKGSCSTMRAGGVETVRLLRARGFGFWSELRTRGGVLVGVGGEGACVSVGVFERYEDCCCDGGAGAFRDGMNAVDFAASTAWSAKSVWYSWIDALDGTWYSTVFD
jgi:hypothetical protein